MKINLYDKKLEGLRGLCALNVAFAHIFTFKFFNSDKTPFYSFCLGLHFAHVAVLLFFIISGYVIGLAHMRSTFNFTNAIDYLKKRAVRLYPIYLLALIISFSVFNQSVSFIQVIGHLAFLQEFFVKTIPDNVVLWSLSYEIVYYLLFLGIWAIKNQKNYYYVVLIISIILYVLITPDFNIFKSLLIGWIFWIVGLFIATLAHSTQDIAKLKLRPFISYFLILLATYSLNSGVFLLNLAHINLKNSTNIGLDDLVYLPICTIIITELTHKRFSLVNWFKVIACIIPALQLVILLYFKHPLTSNQGWLFGSVYFCAAIALCWLKISSYVFEKLNSTGRISYAIYVFHFPIAWFLSYKLTTYLSGEPLFITGVLAWICITTLLSIFAENILQPIIKNYFIKKPGHTSPAKISAFSQ